MSFLLAFVFTYRGALVPLALIPVVVLPWEPPNLYRYLIGLSLFALGVLFRISGVRRIGGRARVHSAGARDLITTGIYGHVRNPLYIGNIFYAAGLVILICSVWSGILAALYLFGLYTLIALYEEQAIEFQMSPVFRRYKGEVPRWRFRLRPYQDHDASDSVASFLEILWWEKYFLAFGIIMVLAATFIHFQPSGLSALTDLVPFQYHPLAGAVLILLVSLTPFLKIAAKLRRKRGSWLKIDRLTKNENAGQPFLGDHSKWR